MPAAPKPVTRRNVVIWFGVTGLETSGLTPMVTNLCIQVLWLMALAPRRGRLRVTHSQTMNEFEYQL